MKFNGMLCKIFFFTISFSICKVSAIPVSTSNDAKFFTAADNTVQLINTVCNRTSTRNELLQVGATALNNVAKAAATVASNAKIRDDLNTKLGGSLSDYVAPVTAIIGNSNTSYTTWVATVNAVNSLGLMISNMAKNSNTTSLTALNNAITALNTLTTQIQTLVTAQASSSDSNVYSTLYPDIFNMTTVQGLSLKDLINTTNADTSLYASAATALQNIITLAWANASPPNLFTYSMATNILSSCSTFIDVINTLLGKASINDTIVQSLMGSVAMIGNIVQNQATAWDQYPATYTVMNAETTMHKQLLKTQGALIISQAATTVQTAVMLFRAGAPWLNATSIASAWSALYGGGSLHSLGSSIEGINSTLDAISLDSTHVSKTAYLSAYAAASSNSTNATAIASFAGAMSTYAYNVHSYSDLS